MAVSSARLVRIITLCFSVAGCCWPMVDAVKILASEDGVSQQAGEDGLLVCMSTPHEASIVWSYNGEQIDPQLSTVRLESREDRVDGRRTVVNSLMLRDMSAVNSGIYTCRSERTGHTDQTELTVVTGKKLVIVKMSLEPRGDGILQLKLQCVGDRRSSMWWYRDGQNVFKDAGIVSVDNTVTNGAAAWPTLGHNRWSSILTKAGPVRDLVGQYVCHDQRKVRADSDVFDVVISEQLAAAATRK